MAETCSLKPCGGCPWKVDSKGGVAIPNFSIEKARNLANTVGPDDGFRTIMACHLTDEGEDAPCIGYLVQAGWSNLSVRMMAISGRLPLSEIIEACEGIELHPDFDAMLVALEETWTDA